MLELGGKSSLTALCVSRRRRSIVPFQPWLGFFSASLVTAGAPRGCCCNKNCAMSSSRLLFRDLASSWEVEETSICFQPGKSCFTSWINRSCRQFSMMGEVGPLARSIAQAPSHVTATRSQFKRGLNVSKSPNLLSTVRTLIKAARGGVRCVPMNKETKCAGRYIACLVPMHLDIVSGTSSSTGSCISRLLVKTGGRQPGALECLNHVSSKH
jgi:hypothetical protein